MTDQQKFFLYSDGNDFLELSGKAEWRDDEKALMLAQNQQPRLTQTDQEDAFQQWKDSVPVVIDAFGSIGTIINNGKALGFKNNWKGSYSIVEDEHGKKIRLEEGVFTDLNYGGDSRLTLGFSEIENEKYAVCVFHLRKRWFEKLEIEEKPVRVWTDADGCSWVLTHSKIYQCSGQPLPHRYESKSNRFEPVQTNPEKLRVIREIELPYGISQTMAVCDDGVRLYFLAIVDTEEGQLQKLFSCFLPGLQQEGEINSDNAQWESYKLPEEIAYCNDIYPVAPSRLSMLLAKPVSLSDQEYKKRDCPVVELNQFVNKQGVIDYQLKLVLQRYPMLSLKQPRFVSCGDRLLRYLSNDGPARLYPLPQARFKHQATFNLRKVLDSGVPDTQWHKIIFEACIPRGCQIDVEVHCADTKVKSKDKVFIPQHKPLWLPIKSEIAFNNGWKEPKRSEHGVFEVLLQRDTGEVRELRGRYLQIRLKLSGDGRSSPAIHSIRVYYPRLCWQESFLPQHFHQQKAVDIDNADNANGADIRQRIFASLEGMLSPIEDRIARSEYLFDPYVAPNHILPNIALTLGLNDIPEHWPEHRKRRLISEAGRLHQLHGTYAGLVLILDIATDGAVASGQIVPLENFRFRRTLSTILGVSLDDKSHPLTLGTGSSGNTIVGDSLILTKKGAREFLALLSPDSYSNEINNSDTESDKKIVEEFFKKYAHQISILLHGEAGSWRSIVNETLQKYAPAHIQWTVKETELPFVLGLAPLLQIDTYLQHKPKPSRVVLNATQLGMEGVIQNESALSPSSAGALL